MDPPGPGPKTEPDANLVILPGLETPMNGRTVPPFGFLFQTLGKPCKPVLCFEQYDLLAPGVAAFLQLRLIIAS